MKTESLQLMFGFWVVQLLVKTAVSPIFMIGENHIYVLRVSSLHGLIFIPFFPPQQLVKPTEMASRGPGLVAMSH